MITNEDRLTGIIIGAAIEVHRTLDGIVRICLRGVPCSRIEPSKNQIRHSASSSYDLQRC